MKPPRFITYLSKERCLVAVVHHRYNSLQILLFCVQDSSASIWESLFPEGTWFLRIVAESSVQRYSGGKKASRGNPKGPFSSKRARKIFEHPHRFLGIEIEAARIYINMLVLSEYWNRSRYAMVWALLHCIRSLSTTKYYKISSNATTDQNWIKKTCTSYREVCSNADISLTSERGSRIFWIIRLQHHNFHQSRNYDINYYVSFALEAKSDLNIFK